MNVAGLFAGIGGLEVGLGEAGHRASLFCEISPAAREVLAARFPGVPREPDILRLSSLPEDVELLVGGFPCQDLSQAGLTAGIEGSRSGLVGRVFQLLDERPVPWVLLENVSFMLQLDRGRALATLVEAFRGARLSLDLSGGQQPGVSASAARAGAVSWPPRPMSIRPMCCSVDDVAPPVKATGLDTHAHGFYWTEGIRGPGLRRSDAIPTMKNGSTVGIPSPPAIMLPKRRGGDARYPRRRAAAGISGRLDGAGRAGRARVDALVAGGKCRHDAGRGVAGGGRLCMPGRYDDSRDMAIDTLKRWPTAARFDGDRRMAVRIGALPVWRERPALAEFLMFPG